MSNSSLTVRLRRMAASRLVTPVGDYQGRGDSRAVIITPPAEPGSATWRWEFADTLLELC